MARSGVRTLGSRPLTEIWGDADGCQQARSERIAVIPRALFRGRPSEDRDIAAAIIVEVFDTPSAGDYPVLKDLDFGLIGMVVLSTISAKFAIALRSQFQSSSASRVTAGAVGFLTLIQQSARPERWGEPRRFDTLPSQPSAQAGL